MPKKIDINYNTIAKNLIRIHSFITFTDSNELYIYKDGIYVPKGDVTVKKILIEKLKEKATIYRISEVINQLKIMTMVDRKSIEDVPINLICIKNGILDIDTRKLKKHDPKLVFFSKFPVIYKKEAKCKEFNKFLNLVVNDEDRPKLQKFIGCCLRRDNAYQRALMLYGRGGGGKSTFLIPIQKFLGEENCTAHLLHELEDKVTVVDLHGKIANIATDIPSKELTHTSKFKAIVSGDPISGRGLYKDPMTFVPTLKLMFSANKIPETYDYSDAFFDRWLLVEFPYNFRDSGEAEENYYQKFLTEVEMSGILNWALEGLDDLKFMGAFADVLDTKLMWLKHSDSVSAFRMEFLTDGTEKEWLGREDIYRKYCLYCRRNNERPKAENAFHQKLQYVMDIEKYQPSIKIEGKKTQIYAWKYVKWRKQHN